MKRYLPLLMLAASFCLVQPLVANEQFNQGMNLSSQNKGQGASAIQGFNPAEVIPGYTNSPPESCLLIRSPDQETSSPGNPQPYPEV
ncbi:conjugal transfer mating pair stabilization protein TraN [Escherichia coli]|nr:conjugal transfer mating pair stabilization protein TraN [Escherichia coli]